MNDHPLNADVPLSVEFDLAEYGHLGPQQNMRIHDRDMYAYFAVFIMGGSVLLVGALKGAFLLLPAPVAFAFGAFRAHNDLMVTAIGQHFRDDLAPSLSRHVLLHEVFRWEKTHRDHPLWVTVKRYVLVAELLVFCVLPFAAVVAYWVQGPGLGMALLSLVDVALVTAIGWLIVAQSNVVDVRAAAGWVAHLFVRRRGSAPDSATERARADAAGRTRFGPR